MDEGEGRRELTVELAVTVGGATHEVQVRAAAEATLADVVEAIDPGARHERVRIDGRDRRLTATASGAGLVAGAHLELDPPARRPTPTPAPVVALAIVAGVGAAGRTVSLPPGTWVLGSAPASDVALDDPAVSSHQALVHVDRFGGVTIEDLCPEHPTRLDDRGLTGPTPAPAGTLLRVGDHAIVVGPVAEPDRGRAQPDHGTPTIAWNRPPRPLTIDAPVPIALPAPSTGGWGAHHSGLVSGLVMALGGLGAYLVLRSPLTLVFLAVGALTTLASAAESRRAERRRRRGEDRRSHQARLRLRRELAAQVAAARLARWRRVPHLADVVTWASTGAGRLWERRTGDPDAFRVAIGVGTLPWVPVVSGTAGGERDEGVQAELDAASSLSAVPVEVELGRGRSVGVVGHGVVADAVARALVLQLAVLHGPADLVIVVAGDRARWGWATWLPHVRDWTGGARRLVVDTVDELDGVLADLPRATDDDGGAGRAGRAGGADRPSVLLVLDEAVASAPPSAARRDVLAGCCGPASVLVVAPTARATPARCDTIIEVVPGGRGRTVHADGSVVADVLVAGCDVALARTTARALARWHDPELGHGGGALPAEVRLLDLLGPGADDPAGMAARWSAAGSDPAPRAPVALAADGVVELDLARDGPHALIAGTTGSGKSELLRSIVAALAARTSPEHLTFVLVDYKGGSAFDRCAELPHAVGLVTDLDGHLGERALRSLDAELAHRERVLRDAGAADLTAYRRLDGVAPLPRLVVVIDEFATLAAELPDFLEALVGIAQRGRSLGVHLLLATQRPSGAVSENIRANTNLRIALRVQDGGDSIDVVGSPAAAHLPRSRPGRMCVRFGPSELVEAHSARTTAPARRAAARRVHVGPFLTGGAVAGPGAESLDDDAGPTELDRLVDAARAAAERLGVARPRRPWLDPLPERVALAALPPGFVALADEPDHQRQPPWAWRPSEGNLVLYGIVGAGTTTALAALALAIAAARPPAEHHLYVLDMGSGALGALAALRHTGAVVGAAEPERRWRLVRTLRALLDRRRAGAGTGEPSEPPGPATTLLIDGYGALAAAHGDVHGGALLDDLARIVTEGPEVGITTVIAAERPGAVPFSVVTTVATKWLFRLADPADFGAFGVRPGALPTFRPGRAVLAETGTEIQIGDPGPLPEAVEVANGRWPGVGAGAAAAPPIVPLPDRVPLASLGPGVAAGYPWRIPVGLADRDLQPGCLVLHEGEHALVAGPARSGRSTTLRTIAAGVARCRPEVTMLVVAPRRSSPSGWSGATSVDEGGLLDALATAPLDVPLVVLIDDAELVRDDRSALEHALVRPARSLHAVAAGRADALRLLYGHWTSVVRRSRTGVLLRPDVDLDADLLATALPRHCPVPPAPGRGYLVTDGVAELVQIATPDPPAPVLTGVRAR